MTPLQSILTRPNRLAAQGQGGDSVVAHLTPGEGVVPPEVMADPAFRSIFAEALQARQLDPDIFTVNANSQINQATGLMEFHGGDPGHGGPGGDDGTGGASSGGTGGGATPAASAAAEVGLVDAADAGTDFGGRPGESGGILNSLNAAIQEDPELALGAFVSLAKAVLSPVAKTIGGFLPEQNEGLPDNTLSEDFNAHTARFSGSPSLAGLGVAPDEPSPGLGLGFAPDDPTAGFGFGRGPDGAQGAGQDAAPGQAPGIGTEPGRGPNRRVVRQRGRGGFYGGDRAGTVLQRILARGR